MEKLNFTKEERNDIAEFIYSYKADILIKNDAIKLIKVLANHGIIDDPKLFNKKVENKEPNISSILFVLVNEIGSTKIDEIMNEYLGIK